MKSIVPYAAAMAGKARLELRWLSGAAIALMSLASLFLIDLGTTWKLIQDGARDEMLCYGYKPRPLGLSLAQQLAFALVDWPTNLARATAWQRCAMTGSRCRVRCCVARWRSPTNSATVRTGTSASSSRPATA